MNGIEPKFYSRLDNRETADRLISIVDRFDIGIDALTQFVASDKYLKLAKLGALPSEVIFGFANDLRHSTIALYTGRIVHAINFKDKLARTAPDVSPAIDLALSAAIRVAKNRDILNYARRDLGDDARFYAHLAGISTDSDISQAIKRAQSYAYGGASSPGSKSRNRSHKARHVR